MGQRRPNSQIAARGKVDEAVKAFTSAFPYERRVVHVRDVAEAAELAEALRGAGVAQWFRGQLRSWPMITPSFARLDAPERDDAMQHIARFDHWVKSTPGLEPIAGHADSAIAVAQHYGLATTFLDFTTEPQVAAFFASHGPAPPDGTESCIICFNVELVDSIWTGLPHGQRPERLELDVPNLWRLEAQAGVFVFCPYRDLETPFGLHRIVFPYTGTVPTPVVEQIYPLEKSPLEALLDQYFMAEELRVGTIATREQADAGAFKLIETPSRDYEEEIFPAGLPVHASWAAERLAPWLEVRRERFVDPTLRDAIELEVDLAADPPSAAPGCAAAVGQALAARSRGQPMAYRVKAGDAGAENRLSRILNRVWDGQVRLPYDDDTLLRGIENCVSLFVWHRRASPSGRLVQGPGFLNDPIQLEFGAADASYSRAWAPSGELRDAMRDDLLEHVAPALRDVLSTDARAVVYGARIPSHVFDFGRLCRVFATWLGPSQAVQRPHDPVFFSPARLRALGLP